MKLGLAGSTPLSTATIVGFSFSMVFEKLMISMKAA
jgi:hypothetical protein